VIIELIKVVYFGQKNEEKKSYTGFKPTKLLNFSKIINDNMVCGPSLNKQIKKPLYNANGPSHCTVLIAQSIADRYRCPFPCTLNCWFIYRTLTVSIGDVEMEQINPATVLAKKWVKYPSWNLACPWESRSLRR
jgi:hypothetical protein